MNDDHEKTYNWNCCMVVAVVNVNDKDIVVDVLDMNDDENGANDDVNENENEDDDISLMDDENEMDSELNEDLKMDVRMES